MHTAGGMNPAPEVISLRGECYIRRDYVTAHEVGGEDMFEFAERVFDETMFWQIVDRDGLANVSSDLSEAMRQMVAASEPHELFYVQFADDGASIRKWSRSPFDGARRCRVALPRAERVST